MHPRNFYRDKIDFTQLADAYPPLKNYLIQASNHPNKIIDFKDQAAQRCLTEALLHRDFNLKISLPPDRLCPPVPNRLNYVLWLQDVISASDYMKEQNAEVMVHGVDIGTGSSAIYPLLACTLEKSWNFVVSEIDPSSFESANRNILANELNHRIRVIQPGASSPILLPLFLDESKCFDFTMCNPPFYGSIQEVIQSAEAKQYGPNAVCTGAEVEMITSGGESTFVAEMVKESLVVRERCRWFTSMLGKLSSVAEIVEIFKSNAIDNYILAEFVQGQTRRWAVGWSFTDIRLPDSISRIPNANPTISKCIPAHNTIKQPVLSASKESLCDALTSILSSINQPFFKSIHNRTTYDMDVDTELNASADFLVFAQEDTWSRSARRRQNQLLDKSSGRNTFEQSSGSAQTASDLVHSSRMACSIHVLQPPANDSVVPPSNPALTESKSATVTTTEKFTMEFNWRQGRDRDLFASFCSHISRKMR
ncbi:hypothetical protein C8R42DRAFT_659899 [Lentinula raphanica]|nr:hypothetical protein C8R42DRAFT_659899 [Lentinula raphanica]